MTLIVPGNEENYSKITIILSGWSDINQTLNIFSGMIQNGSIMLPLIRFPEIIMLSVHVMNRISHCIIKLRPHRPIVLVITSRL